MLSDFLRLSLCPIFAGDRGAGGFTGSKIPPGSNLFFEVELVELGDEPLLDDEQREFLRSNPLPQDRLIPLAPLNPPPTAASPLSPPPSEAPAPQTPSTTTTTPPASAVPPPPGPASGLPEGGVLSVAVEAPAASTAEAGMPPLPLPATSTATSGAPTATASNGQ